MNGVKVALCLLLLAGATGCDRSQKVEQKAAQERKQSDNAVQQYQRELDKAMVRGQQTRDDYDR